MVVGRDIPSILYGSQEDYKKLYYSEPSAALKIPITISPGYGILNMGTALSKNDSTAGNVGKYLPYDPTATITGAEDAPGRANLVQDSGAVATDLYVTIADAYKFIVGDDVIIVDSDGEGAAENLGAITAIDVTTYTQMAVITVTDATSDDFTTAKFAYITCEGYNTCDGILEKSVQTGVGENSQGAIATMIWGNCMLYVGGLLNVDSNARTDLSATALGSYLGIR